ncbi:hypothetical protein MRB53_039892 [Persea americana]|nr:hypothetical protein MRB53_039892 [Persea americana]
MYSWGLSRFSIDAAETPKGFRKRAAPKLRMESMLPGYQDRMLLDHVDDVCLVASGQKRRSKNAGSRKCRRGNSVQGYFDTSHLRPAKQVQSSSSVAIPHVKLDAPCRMKRVLHMLLNAGVVALGHVRIAEWGKGSCHLQRAQRQVPCACCDDPTHLLPLTACRGDEAHSCCCVSRVGGRVQWCSAGRNGTWPRRMLRLSPGCEALDAATHRDQSGHTRGLGLLLSNLIRC